MAGKRDNTEERRRPLGKDASAQEIQEELAYLRQTCNSLSFRGHYAECVKMIEDNLETLYFKERWPENFLTVLKLHQKCYPSLHKEQPHEEYLTALLKKHNIPFVFAQMLRGKDTVIVWKAEHFRDLAQVSATQEDYETALAYCDILLKLDPGSAAAHIVKAGILEDMGRGADALKMYDQALELGPGNRFALSGLAKHYCVSNPKKALEYIEQAIEANPDDANFHIVKADILIATGDEDGAVQALDAAQKCDPYNAEIPFKRGEIYLAEDNRVKAVTQYRMAIALGEHHIPTLQRLVEVSKDGQPALALGYCTTLCSLQPNNREACLTRARLLRKTGDQDGAVKQYQQLLELDPQSHEARGEIGAIYLGQGQAQLALPFLAEAAQLAPKEAQYHFDKARAHQKLDENEAAVAELKESVALDKTNPRAWAELGYLHRQASPKEALGYFEKAIALSPEDPYYYTAKGELLLAQPGAQQQAMECFDLACKYDPGNAELHATLGRLLAGVMNIASAVDHFRKAVHLDPNDAESFYHLARLLIDTQPDQALLHVGRAIMLSVTRGDYYYLKARVLLALTQDPEAQTRLKEALADGKHPETESDSAELEAGNGTRIALLYINRAIELDSENPAFLCMRAHLLFMLGQKGKAQDQYEKLLAVSPNQHEALFGLARIHAASRDKKTLDYFNKAIAAAPAVAEYHAEKAAYLAQEEDGYEQAVAEYTEAIALNTQAWQVILEKARLLDSHGEDEEAMHEYRRVLMLRRDCLEAAARLGVMLTDYSPAHALIYLEHASRLEPGSFLHPAWRAKARFALEDEAGAQLELAAALELGGDSAETQFTIASILEEIRPELALEHVQRAIEHSDKKAEYHLLCGNLLLAREELTAAKECYRRTVALESKNYEAHEKLARIAYFQGDENALELAEAALAVKADFPPCLYIKARILMERQEDYNSAIEFVKYAIELEPKNLAYRELLVELLGKKRSLIKQALEKRKLDKLRRKLEEPLTIPEPPPLEEEPETDEAAPESQAAQAPIPGEAAQAQDEAGETPPDSPPPQPAMEQAGPE